MAGKIADREVREKMKQFRETYRISEQDMADRCLISKELLFMVESGHVTSPGIAARIQKQYMLTDLEAETLLPKNRRFHGGEYDPDKWVHPVDLNGNKREVQE